MSGKRAPLAGGGKSGLKESGRLLIASAVAILLTGCGLPAERGVQAYEACMSRHPQETALCEGPRKAFDVDTSIYQARATTGDLPR